MCALGSDRPVSERYLCALGSNGNALGSDGRVCARRIAALVPQVDQLAQDAQEMAERATRLQHQARALAGLPARPTGRGRGRGGAVVREPPPVRGGRAHPELSREKDAQGRFSCSRCRYKNKSFHLLKGHFQTHLMPGEKSQDYKCDEDGCGKVFTRKFSLDRHKKTHAFELGRPFQCSFCPYQAMTQQAVGRHEQRVHSDGREDRECEFCHRVLRNVKEETLTHHQRYCEENPAYEGPYFCRNQCGAKFVRSAEERRHQAKCPRKQ